MFEVVSRIIFRICFDLIVHLLHLCWLSRCSHSPAWLTKALITWLHLPVQFHFKPFLVCLQNSSFSCVMFFLFWDLFLWSFFSIPSCLHGELLLTPQCPRENGLLPLLCLLSTLYSSVPPVTSCVMLGKNTYPLCTSACSSVKWDDKITFSLGS